MNLQNKTQIKLTNQDYYSPRFSPNQKHIVFVSGRIDDEDGDDKKYFIYVMNADGTHRKKLVTDAFAHAQCFSPDGRKIAFVSSSLPYDKRKPCQISLMHRDGTHRVRLTHNIDLGVDYFDICFSPNGKTIAFVSHVEDGASEIMAMKADGTALHNLTRGGNDEDPCFSPDGKHIAFTSRFKDKSQIYIMNADGSHRTLLTSNGYNSAPTWAPGFVPAPTTAPK